MTPLFAKIEFNDSPVEVEHDASKTVLSGVDLESGLIFSPSRSEVTTDIPFTLTMSTPPRYSYHLGDIDHVRCQLSERGQG
ncbi:hypothetical protein TNCV_2182851 [Trichonephila clavipes]|uniref:Uncharacterized protein n=1 Tax=Trichonephila clavipes TaxID=2585209 RepID=A0A8X6VV34_TRICX|nr:hypothetical protein TNCV_2182851 [Trichonephila clavipes]